MFIKNLQAVSAKLRDAIPVFREVQRQSEIARQNSGNIVLVEEFMSCFDRASPSLLFNEAVACSEKINERVLAPILMSEAIWALKDLSSAMAAPGPTTKAKDTGTLQDAVSGIQNILSSSDMPVFDVSDRILTFKSALSVERSNEDFQVTNAFRTALNDARTGMLFPDNVYTAMRLFDLVNLVNDVVKFDAVMARSLLSSEAGLPCLKFWQAVNELDSYSLTPITESGGVWRVEDRSLDSI